jgi:hypothetical protein
MQQTDTHSWRALDNAVGVIASSEDPQHPIRGPLSSPPQGEWRAAVPGEQSIRLLFAGPTTLARIRVVFWEGVQTRTQEFTLHWRAEDGVAQEIVRQQFTFSPAGAVEEVEEYAVHIRDAVTLELTIVPDIEGGPAFATLTEWRLA